MIFLRSLLFWPGYLALCVFYSVVSMLVLPLPRMMRCRIVYTLSPCIMFWLRLTVGLRYQVSGLENFPKAPCVMLAKHQSTWETQAFSTIFPAHTWVIKRELLWIPFFGWMLWLVSAIAINRSNARESIKQMYEQGRERLSIGLSILIFPEGTRVAAGEKGEYKSGGVRLAKHLKVPMVPIAHNGGEFWPRGSFLIYPGVISVVVGEPITHDAGDANTINAQVEAWIEGEMARIGGVGPCHPKNRTAS